MNFYMKGRDMSKKEKIKIEEIAKIIRQDFERSSKTDRLDLKFHYIFSKYWKDLNNKDVIYIVGEAGSEYEVPEIYVDRKTLRRLSYYLKIQSENNVGRIADFYRCLERTCKILSVINKIGDYEALILKIAIVIAICENDMSVLYPENITSILSNYGIFETTDESMNFMSKLLASLRQELPALARDMEIYLIRLEECC